MAMETNDRVPETGNSEASKPAGRAWVVLLVLLILCAGTALRMKDFRQPWKTTDPSLDSSLGLKGFGGALYSNIARNHVRYGYQKTRGAMVTCGGQRHVEELVNHRYLNHPPLIGILLSFSFHLFDVHEWSARLVPLVFSALSLLMMFVVCRLVAGTGPALIACALMAAMPMAVYYGTFVEVQSFQVMFTSLVIFWFYWKWHLSRRRLLLWGFLAVFFLGAFMDWPVYLLAFGLFLHHLLAPGERGRSPGIWFWLPAAVFLAFGLNVVFVYLMSGRNVGSLAHAWSVETGISQGIVDMFRTGEWIMWPKALKGFFLRMYTLPLLLFTAAYMLRALLGLVFRKPPVGGGLVFAYFCMGAGYVILFPYGSTIHEYWSMYLVPVFAAGTAFILWEVTGLITHRIPRQWIVDVTVTILVLSLGIQAWNRFTPGIEYKTSYYVQAGKALRALTGPEDTVAILGNHTETVFYAYYSDRTINLLKVEDLLAKPEAADRIEGRYVAIPRDLRAHPLRKALLSYEVVRDRLRGKMSAVSPPVNAGPLVLFRNPWTKPESVTPPSR